MRWLSKLFRGKSSENKTVSHFDKCLEITLTLEGNSQLSMNRNDPGNWTGGKIGSGELKGTRYGIAASAYPNLDIKNLTYEEAKKIYRKRYWDFCKLDTVAWPMCAAIFDFAVQSGPNRALRYYKIKTDFNSYMDAREKFLSDWEKKHPGNRGVLKRVKRLRDLIGGANGSV